jgi:glycosyltransferase involved in cell wall biosynthesis
MSGAELVVVMPVYNEEALVTSVVTEWLDAMARENVAGLVIAVNDGSNDATRERLNSLQSKFARQMRVVEKTNSGHGRSCRAGYEAALRMSAAWILQVDSDGQCDPAYFPRFWAGRRQADCVFGIRVGREDGFMRKALSAACSVFAGFAARADLKDANVPYRLMRREALERALTAVPPDLDMQNVALTVALKRDPKLRWAYVPIDFRARRAGTSMYTPRQIFQTGCRILMEIGRVGK